MDGVVKKTKHAMKRYEDRCEKEKKAIQVNRKMLRKNGIKKPRNNQIKKRLKKIRKQTEINKERELESKRQPFEKHIN